MLLFFLVLPLTVGFAAGCAVMAWAATRPGPDDRRSVDTFDRARHALSRRTLL